MLLALALLGGILFVFAPSVIPVITPGFDAAQTAETVDLTRIMLLSARSSSRSARWRRASSTHAAASRRRCSRRSSTTSRSSAGAVFLGALDGPDGAGRRASSPGASSTSSSSCARCSGPAGFRYAPRIDLARPRGSSDDPPPGAAGDRPRRRPAAAPRQRPRSPSSLGRGRDHGLQLSRSRSSRSRSGRSACRSAIVALPALSAAPRAGAIGEFVRSGPVAPPDGSSSCSRSRRRRLAAHPVVTLLFGYGKVDAGGARPHGRVAHRLPHRPALGTRDRRPRPRLLRRARHPDAGRGGPDRGRRQRRRLGRGRRPPGRCRVWPSGSRSRRGSRRSSSRSCSSGVCRPSTWPASRGVARSWSARPSAAPPCGPSSRRDGSLGSAPGKIVLAAELAAVGLARPSSTCGLALLLRIPEVPTIIRLLLSALRRDAPHERRAAPALPRRVARRPGTGSSPARPRLVPAAIRVGAGQGRQRLVGARVVAGAGPDRRPGPPAPAATAAVGVRLRAARAGGDGVDRGGRGCLHGGAPAARPGRVSHVRIDPEVERDGPVDPDGRCARSCADAGWRPAPPIQPTATRIIDLTAGEAALWGDLRKKWRQYVNKARANGVTRGRAAGRSDRRRSTRSTARRPTRAGFLIRVEQAYRDVWDAFRPDRRRDASCSRSTRTGRPSPRCSSCGAGAASSSRTAA